MYHNLFHSFIIIIQISGNCPWKYVVYFSSTSSTSECEIGLTDEISEQNSSLIVPVELPFDCSWEVVIETRKGLCRTNSTRPFDISKYKYLDSPI